MRIEHLPILGISGHSGSGKTTLIEAVLPALRARGLSVAVAKHDAHGPNADQPGEDSDRFFRAGADVLLAGPDERFCRWHGAGESDDAVRRLATSHDLVLVEGHKDRPWPKVWLLGEGEARPPAGVESVLAVLARDADRPARAGRLLSIIDGWLPTQWRRPPLLGCVLIGGRSRRMGQPKHLLLRDGHTLLERTVALLEPATEQVVIVGAGEAPASLSDYPRLPDVPDVAGPLTGLLAVMRWAPDATWLVTACDHPDLSAEALAWLCEQRRPGAWAIQPRVQPPSGPDDLRVEPLLALYDSRARGLLERLAGRGGDYRLRDLAADAKVASPVAPTDLAAAWRNVNTPVDLHSSAGGQRDGPA